MIAQNEPKLKFDAYDNDPLAKFILTGLDWGEKRLGLVYVAIYLALVGLAFLVLSRREAGINLDLLGGYSVNFALGAVIVVAGGFGSGFYLYISKKVGVIYYELWDSRVLASSDSSQVGLLNAKIASIRKAHRKRIWPILAVLFAVVFGVVIAYFSGFYPGREETTRERATIVLFTQVAWMLGFYMIGMIIIRALLTIWGLRTIFQTWNIDVQPFHPDGCGGLNDLRDYALSLAYVIAVFGFAIASFLFITSQVVDGCQHHLINKGEMHVPERCHDELMKDGIITANDGEVVQLVPDNHQKLRGAELHTDFGRTLRFPVTWLGIVLYVILAPTVFFGTLASAHHAMREKKLEQLESLSTTFNNEYRVVHGGLVNNTPVIVRQFEHLKRIRELHEMTAAFPVWPWDMGTIRKFLAAVTGLPIIPILASIGLEIAK